jgi:hypothetical protein
MVPLDKIDLGAPFAAAFEYVGESRLSPWDVLLALRRYQQWFDSLLL